MSSRFAWLFNNEQGSDISIAIALEVTHTHDVKKPCIAKTTQQKPADSATRLLCGHSIILASSSEFFRARCSGRWDNETCQSSTSKANIAARDVTLVVQSEAQIIAAERMIKCIYCEELDGELSVDDILQVMQISDMFGVELAVAACIDRLKAIHVDTFTFDELQHAMTLPTSLHANKRFHKLFTRMVDRAVSDLVNLESAWQDEGLRDMLVNLPVEAILQLLKKDHLVVMSENIVLVAALSWLRGPVGSHALEYERKAVMELVRLLQLTPTFQSLLLMHMPEAKDLISAHHMSSFFLQLASTAAQQCVFGGKALPRAWTTARAAPEPQDIVRTEQFNVKVEDLLVGIKLACEGACEGAEQTSGVLRLCESALFLDGYCVRPRVAIARVKKSDKTGLTSCLLVLAVKVDVVVNGQSLVLEGSFTRPRLTKITYGYDNICDRTREMQTSSRVTGVSIPIKDCSKPLQDIGHLLIDGCLRVQYVISNPLHL